MESPLERVWSARHEYVDPRGYLKLLEAMLDAGADIDAKDRYGSNIIDVLKRYLVLDNENKDKQEAEAALAIIEQYRKRNRAALADTIADICVSMHSLKIPSYVILEIVNNLPNSTSMTDYEKMKLIDGIKESCNKI